MGFFGRARSRVPSAASGCQLELSLYAVPFLNLLLIRRDAFPLLFLNNDLMFSLNRTY